MQTRAPWEAINAYVKACGGDPSANTISVARMEAVTAVERAYDRACPVFYVAEPTKEESLQIGQKLIETATDLLRGDLTRHTAGRELFDFVVRNSRLIRCP